MVLAVVLLSLTVLFLIYRSMRLVDEIYELELKLSRLSLIELEKEELEEKINNISNKKD